MNDYIEEEESRGDGAASNNQAVHGPDHIDLHTRPQALSLVMPEDMLIMQRVASLDRRITVKAT
jgi:hypothetical protein